MIVSQLILWSAIWNIVPTPRTTSTALLHHVSSSLSRKIHQRICGNDGIIGAGIQNSFFSSDEGTIKVKSTRMLSRDTRRKHDIARSRTVSPLSALSTAEKSSSSSSYFRPGVNHATLGFNDRLNKMAQQANFHKRGQAQTMENILMDAFSAFKNYDEKEFSTMSGRSQIVKPNVVSFTAVINAWARTPEQNAAQRAETLLNRMEDYYSQTNDAEIRPNKFSYNAVLTAWARNKDRRTSAENSLRLLKQMWKLFHMHGNVRKDIKPDARSYNTVINAVARSGFPNCADRAYKLLVEMEELYHAGHDELIPNASTFGAIINAYANSGQEESSDQAAKLLQQMNSLYHLGHDDLKPNTFVYNSCINAFAKNGQNQKEAEKTSEEIMAKRINNICAAEQILQSMESQFEKTGDEYVKPDVISYSTVINAYANSGDGMAGSKADVLLEKMVQRYVGGDFKVKPNAVTYTSVIKAWSSVGGTQSTKRMEALLQQMVMLYRAGDQSLKPTSVSFDLVIEGFKDSGDKNGVKRVENTRVAMHRK